MAYLGKGRSASPSVKWTDPEKRFDPAVRHAAEDVVSHLDAIATGWTTDDWNVADARVRADLVSTFPELDEAAVNALLWKFDYDWK